MVPPSVKSVTPIHAIAAATRAAAILAGAIAAARAAIVAWIVVAGFAPPAPTAEMAYTPFAVWYPQHCCSGVDLEKRIVALQWERSLAKNYKISALQWEHTWERVPRPADLQQMATVLVRVAD
eukprot:SAG11_NODE_437_length_9468_cov_12.581385_3_plen_123_part_00